MVQSDRELRSFRYGPAERLWRCLTWWRRTPIPGRAAAQDQTVPTAA